PPAPRHFEKWTNFKIFIGDFLRRAGFVLLIVGLGRYYFACYCGGERMLSAPLEKYETLNRKKSQTNSPKITSHKK
ncbi:MAG: hypothetical protein FWG65_05675, partial [Turicibacter sp.]|nr:hypothetical protein [Turicibacter sp.]